MHRGYIKLWRKISDHPLHPLNRRGRDWSGYEAMIDLVMMAHGGDEHKKVSKGNQTIEIKRGQIDKTNRQLADRWRWSLGKVNNFLQHLKDERFIALNVNRWFTLITIEKYDEFNPRNERNVNGKRTEVERNVNTIEREVMKDNESNEKKERGEQGSPTPSQTMVDFIFIVSEKGERYREFISRMQTKTKLSNDKISAELDKFVSYWAEKTPNGKKERWQLQKAFEVQKRLATWFSKMQNFDQNRPKTGGVRIIS